MRVYIRNERKTVTVRLYGLDGSECTKRFFDTFFKEVREVHETTDEERSAFGTDAEYTIDEIRLFNALADVIGDLQEAIDHVAIGMIDETPVEDFTYNDAYYAI